MKNIFIIAIAVIVFTGCKRNATEKTIQVDVVARQTIDNILLSPSSENISAIPLMITANDNATGRTASAVNGSSQQESALTHLTKLSFPRPNERKIIAISSGHDVNTRLRNAYKFKEITNQEYEFEATVVLRDLKLLKDTSKAARVAIKENLDNLLAIKSQNIALEYFALKAIAKDLSASQVNAYSTKILEITAYNKNYTKASALKRRIISALQANPAKYNSLIKDVSFLATIKVLRAKTTTQDYFKSKLVALNQESKI